MYLARAGWKVQVFERRPEPGPANTSRQRSWVLAMYPRGIRPVNEVAQVPLLAERAYKGLVIKPAKPDSKSIVLERSGVLMDRTLLATSLLDAARAQYSGRVSFTFNAGLSSVDFQAKTAVFASDASAATFVNAEAAGKQLVGAAAATAAAGGSSSGAAGAVAVASGLPQPQPQPQQQYSASYDLLVGADGSSSALRSLLEAAMPGQFQTEVLSPGTGCYKSVYGLPSVPEVEAWNPDNNTPPEKRVQGEFFIFLSGGTKGMMSMCRDIDGNYCGYMAGTQQLFAELKTREDYMAVLPQAAPQLPAAWLPLIADRMMEAPVSTFPTMRSLSRFWAPGGVVLVGDAAHTVTPALGQGLNSALQDCEMLAAELAAAPSLDAGGIDAAIRNFSETRAPEVRALQELELLQSAALSPLNWSTEPGRWLTVLLRKWILFHYSGLALLGTVAATAMAANAAKKRREGKEAPAVSRTDRLAEQVEGTYVRNPPMYELLKAHMNYRDMLLRVRGMAALGSAGTFALLYGLFSGAASLASRALGA
ncbi:hypothetical protein HYH02_000775 [Chlamydomonas schloesseri]|uniref:FAD-binding domain-containing protein n=1 Tax=Chlamydomonas schloesseri TaxID=2026947 RepID=A0A835WVS8_9CHLO|nr:hypothetical protein HYH02_000775 [Chlamydomonas schloesseri]|eukprot:KAG2454947.1 hypothetical protein HYH02_000775 [Chlamydomonas schloesseri]